VVAALAGAQYLAGFVFLWLIDADPSAATPLTVARYVYYHGAREDVAQLLWLSSAAGLLLIFAPATVLVIPTPRPLHGDARFATRRAMARTGLFHELGIVLGRVNRGVGGGRFLYLAGQMGVALIARPRAGKGVSVVIPNLLTWPHSVVCSDVKKENWTLTAGYRRACGQAVYLFDPLARDGRTARWNPLDYVSEEPGQRVSDLQLIASMFFPDPPGADPFWAAGGRSLFLGIALYLFSTPSYPHTIGEILRQGMATDEEGFAAHWKRVIHGRMSGAHPLPDTCVRALYDVIDLAPQTASSIRKTFTSRLELWANPVLDAATSASDFDLRQLRRRPISIYLGVMPKDLDRLAPLMSLFFQQAIALQTDELPEHNPALTHQVLMVLDEFAALGRIPILTKASGFLPGYNVRILLILQALSQLREVYGENGAKTLLKTLAARIFFAPNDMEDAEEISRELGTTTVSVKTTSRSAFHVFDLKARRPGSVSISEQKRPLLLPQEVKDLGAHRQIVFLENLRPILCRKIVYYRTRLFRRRLLPPPAVAPIEPIGVASRAVAPAVIAASVTGETPAKPATRAATPEDIERIDELTLEDFAVDFDRVHLPEKPEGERMTPQEMEAAVESFIAALREG
jgi:type IV secretion system protein VirD4